MINHKAVKLEWMLASLIIIISCASFGDSSIIYAIARSILHEVDLLCPFEPSNVVGNIYWYGPGDQLLSENTAVITPDSRFTIQQPYPNEMDIRISNLQKTDGGIYYCDLQPSTPSFQRVWNLTITWPPMLVDNSPRVISSRVGEDQSMFCRGSGSPSPIVTWYKLNYAKQAIALNVTGEDFILKNVTARDSGSYKCVLDNGVRPLVDAQIELSVLFPPVVQLSYEEVVQGIGKATEMTCLVMANPIGEVYWEHRGQRLNQSTKYGLYVSDVDLYTKKVLLSISALTTDDYGAYTCQANNTYGSAGQMVKLLHRRLQNGAACNQVSKELVSEVGNFATIDCTTEATIQHETVTWWRMMDDSNKTKHPLLPLTTSLIAPNDSSASNETSTRGTKYQQTGQTELRINNLTADDAGYYGCEKQNHTLFHLMIVERLICTGKQIRLAESEMAELSCQLVYHGRLPSNHKRSKFMPHWYYGTQRLSGFIHEQQGLRTSLLRFDLLFPAHRFRSGVYTCGIGHASVPINVTSFISACHVRLEISGASSTIYSFAIVTNFFVVVITCSVIMR